MKNKRFFSLKWKFVLIFSSVFLLLLMISGYKLYWDATKNFALNQEKKAANHIYVAHALTHQSFTSFAQLVDLFFSTAQTKTIPENLAFINKNWQQWQVLAGVENTLIFDPQGKLLQRWGSGLTPRQDKVLQTINQEKPQQQLDCSGACFQHTLIPIIGNGELIAVVSMAKKFSDIIIE